MYEKNATLQNTCIQQLPAIYGKKAVETWHKLQVRAGRTCRRAGRLYIRAPRLCRLPAGTENIRPAIRKQRAGKAICPPSLPDKTKKCPLQHHKRALQRAAIFYVNIRNGLFHNSNPSVSIRFVTVLDSTQLVVQFQAYRTGFSVLAEYI